VNRLLARIFRRASLPLMYSQGFSPKPLLVFGPALSLGVPALAELVDVRLDVDLSAEEIHGRLREVTPEGLNVTQVDRLLPGAPNLGKLIDTCDWLFMPRGDGLRMDVARLERLAQTFLARDSVPLERDGHKDYAARTVDARAHVRQLSIVSGDPAGALAVALDWVGPEDPLPIMMQAQVSAGASGGGTVRPAELAKVLGLEGARIARLGIGFGDPAALLAQRRATDSLPAAAGMSPGDMGTV
jgi:radical SAM-linked protein